MKILGISAYYHDSAAALIIDNQIVCAVQEERFSRIKNDAAFPLQAIAYCLESQNLDLDDIDYIAYYEKPLLKFERILKNFYTTIPFSLPQFLASMPIWVKQKLFLKSDIKKQLKKNFDFNKTPKFLFPEHHLSHAASSYFPSGFQDAAILTIDGVGEWATAGIFEAHNGEITKLKEMAYPDSVGLLYSAFTFFLGFRVNFGEYKLMGLAPYGNVSSDLFIRSRDLILSELVSVFDDGSISLNSKYFRYTHGLRMIHQKRWEKLFGMKMRTAEQAILQDHCDLALAIQNVLEEIVLKMVAQCKTLTSSTNLCLSGGVALNCVSNGKILETGLFKNVFIQSAAGDAGGAIGAALISHNIMSDQSYQPTDHRYALLGPSYTDAQIEECLTAHNCTYDYFEDFDTIIKIVIDAIISGKYVAWFQDNLEFGPRALGNRSIIADPRSINAQRDLNLKVKSRESFRPFAPIMLMEEAERYYGLDKEEPFMLLVHKLKKEYRHEHPSFNQMNMEEKLAFKKSDWPAITHVDYSSRIQTVNKHQNPKFSALLQEMKKRSGAGILVNTSFNSKDEPIVCSPQNAIECYIQTKLDILVLGNYIVRSEWNH